MMTDEPPAVALDGVCWGPPGRDDVLHDLTLAVAPGEVLAICGPNGAGKSSALRLVFGQTRPRRGSVRLFGNDLARMPSRDTARQVAVVLQDPAGDCGLTVRQIVALGRLPYRDRAFGGTADDGPAVRGVLALLDLAEFPERTFASLSGGERQRVMLARALAQTPRVLVLDEPTNHLDIRHQIDLLAVVRGLGLTVIVTLHDLGLAADHADRVAVLHQGRLVACGTPAAALSPATLHTAFRVRARGALQFAFQV